ncbi:hypothetical protein B0O99DRAFT_731512 [Bisporella sp. PMI_857]|nr:hypothetical protein B0O99DRAFT_731512 [Bisporella sp. PMI_857]
MRSAPRMRLKALSLHPTITFEKDKYLRLNRDTCTYLALDLKTPRLRDIHQHLWLAGLPNAARSLHRQGLIGRSILISKDPNEHLVSFEAQIYIKPLPGFLLDHDYWKDNLCSDQELRESACGLLLSYAWLVRHKSDLDIAKESGLVSKNIECPTSIETLSYVNKRYKYRELRLSRLSAIYRLIPPAYSMKSFIRGYRAGSTWYNAFFERHFKWMLAVFVVLSVLLSVLQVGLATHILRDSGAFSRCLIWKGNAVSSP